MQRLRDEDLYTKRQPFLDLQPPDKNGVPTYYTVKFLQEPMKVKDRQGRKHLYARVQLMGNVGAYAVGTWTLDMIRVTLQKKLLRLSPLCGKTFAIANLGKPFAKSYGYDVQLLGP